MDIRKILHGDWTGHKSRRGGSSDPSQAPVDKVLLGSAGNIQSITAKVIPGVPLNAPPPGQCSNPEDVKKVHEKRLSTEVKFTDGTTLTYDCAKHQVSRSYQGQTDVLPNTDMAVKVYKPGYMSEFGYQLSEITLRNDQMKEVIHNGGSAELTDYTHAQPRETPLPSWCDQPGDTYMFSDNSGAVRGTKDGSYRNIRAGFLEGSDTIQVFSKRGNPTYQLTPFYVARAPEAQA